MDERLKLKFYEGKSREEITELFYDMFYGALSRRVWLTYEKDGADWLEEALTAYGKDRGEELSALFHANQKEKSIRNLIQYFDFIVRGDLQLTETEAPGCFCVVVSGSPRIENMLKYGTEFCIELYLRTVFPALITAFSTDLELVSTQVDLANHAVKFTIKGPIGQEEPGDFDCGKEYAALVKDLYDTMYAFIAETVIRRAGAEGEQIVRRGIRDFGICRGKRLRTMQDEEGLERNLFNLMDYYDIPSVEGYYEEKEEFTPIKDICNVETCNHFVRWRKKNMLRYGIMYCEEVHNAFWTAYNEAIIVQQPEILTRGDSRCRFVTKIVED